MAAWAFLGAAGPGVESPLLLLVAPRVLSELCWWRLGLRCFGLLEVPSGLRPVLSHRLVVLGRRLLHWWVGGLGPGLGLGGWCLESLMVMSSTGVGSLLLLLGFVGGCWPPLWDPDGPAAASPSGWSGSGGASGTSSSESSGGLPGSSPACRGGGSCRCSGCCELEGLSDAGSCSPKMPCCHGSSFGSYGGRCGRRACSLHWPLLGVRAVSERGSARLVRCRSTRCGGGCRRARESRWGPLPGAWVRL